MKKSLLCGIAAAGAFASAAGLADPPQSEARARSHGQVGIASFYSVSRKGGALTAAHRTLPLGSLVRVRNLKTGRTITVRITDRGPFIAGRVIDLSTHAAQAIGIRNQGLARVEVSLAGRRTSRAAAKTRRTRKRFSAA
jgi:rare lipoprotein A